MSKNIYNLMRSVGWWLQAADHHPAGPARETLVGRWFDLCGLVMQGEGCDSIEEAEALLLDGYIEKWIQRVLYPQTGEQQ